METLLKSNIGQIVAADYRTAAIFTKYDLDFCCKGNRTIEEACGKKGIDKDEIVRNLNQILAEKTGQSIDYRSWPIDLLADYIEKKHHRYVEEQVPVLLQYINKLCSVHGERHPELFQIKELFITSSKGLASHMKREELLLFPYIRRLVGAKLYGRSIENPLIETTEITISQIMEEHEEEGDRLREISELTNGYTCPEDGCQTYRVTLSMLEDFEKDLHLHIHLENNILFPEAIKLEKLLV